MNDRRYLRRKTPPPPVSEARGTFRVADLFCGCGGMSLGAFEAARRAGLAYEIAMAVDSDPDATLVFDANLGPSRVAKIEEYFDGETESLALTPRERCWRRVTGPVDLLLGGPPCQGNSDLNNHTRRIDPRNELYVRMARAAHVLRPLFVLVENVPAVVHDKGRAVEVTRRQLERGGYSTWEGILNLEWLGVPQRRRRHFLVASRVPSLSAPEIVDGCKRLRELRTVGWAIEDLQVSNGNAFDRSGAMSPQNRRRLEWLFENDAHVLPDELRPTCHRLRAHTYKSVYGRMRWSEPAPTITTGFGSMGQGCFVHPKLPRTITPHEAARLQTFPDFFAFSVLGRRTSWARLIGNAVPPLAVMRLITPIATFFSEQ